MDSSPRMLQVSMARRRVYKNLLVIGLSWLFIFTAYTSVSNLQSSLNNEDGLGTTSLSIIYISLIVSCIFLPSTLLEKLGVKYTILFSQIGYVTYIIANVYPKYYTLVPAAIFIGCKKNGHRYVF